MLPNSLKKKIANLGSGIFLLGLSVINLFLLVSCTNHPSSPYVLINNKLKKDYNLSNGELIINYNLNRSGNKNDNSIYAKDLGLIINDHNYSKNYLTKFAADYKSPAILQQEAIRKIREICRVLISLEKKYHFLPKTRYSYIKTLSTARKPSDSEIKSRTKQNLAELDKIIEHIPLMVPEYKPVVTSKYGARKHPIKGQQRLHTGVDLVADKGGSVFAAASGVVIFSSKKNGYGNTVEIQHDYNLTTLYAHLNNITVKKGQKVFRGEIIGKQGKSGKVISEHLHFEIRLNNNPVNPHNFIFPI